jgi:hypothetical protein
MIDPPAVQRRYQTGARQRSDEAGRRQEYDHDGVALLELVDRHHDGALFAGARQRGDAV